MRCARRLVGEDCTGLYHVLSRVVDRRLVFGEVEKARFRSLLRAYAEFSGIDVVAWCLMGNHFHLLLRVPPRRGEQAPEISDQEVVRRVGLVNGPMARKHLENLLSMSGSEAGRREILAPFRRRMGDLGQMMKTLKQRFTQWFNGRHQRKGTLWEERYRSYIIPHNEEFRGGSRDFDLGEIARIVAAYIDNNPVRAGIVDDAGTYPWCGFGEAALGQAGARDRISRLWGLPAGEAMEAHRRMMMVRGVSRVEPDLLARNPGVGVRAAPGESTPSGAAGA